MLGTHDFFIPIGSRLPTTGLSLIWFLLGGGLLGLTGYGLLERTGRPT